MEKVISFYEKRIRENFSIWDIGFLKVYGLIIGLFIGVYYPEVVFKFLSAFLFIFAVLLFRYMYLLFIKKQ